MANQQERRQEYDDDNGDDDEKVRKIRMEATADIREQKKVQRYNDGIFFRNQRRDDEGRYDYTMANQQERRQEYDDDHGDDDEDIGDRYAAFETNEGEEDRQTAQSYSVNTEEGKGEAYHGRHKIFETNEVQDLQQDQFHHRPNKTKEKKEAYDRYVCLASEEDEEEERERYIALAKQTREEEWLSYKREENDDERYVCLA